MSVKESKKNYSEGFSHCAIGAIELVAETDNEVRAVNLAVINYLEAETGRNWGSIPSFNDAKGRTAEEVREALLMTAKKLRNGE